MSRGASADAYVSSDGITIPYAEVLGITFYSGYSHSTFIDRSAGILIIRSATARLKLAIRHCSFSWHDVDEVSNYSKILSETINRIAPVTLRRLAASVLSGHVVTIGSFSLDSHGITHTGFFTGRRRAPWNLLPEVRSLSRDHWYVAMTQTGVLEVSYFYPPTGKMIVVGSVTSREENGFLLPFLVDFMTSRHKPRVT